MKKIVFIIVAICFMANPVNAMSKSVLTGTTTTTLPFSAITGSAKANQLPPAIAYDMLSTLQTVSSVTGTTSIDYGALFIVSDSTPSSNYVITLPSCTTSNVNKMVGLSMSPAMTSMITVTIATGTELIDGANTRVLWANETAMLLCNGTTWVKVAGKSIPMNWFAYNPLQQTNLTSGVYTKATFTTALYNMGNAYNASTSKFTPRRNGKWILKSSVSVRTAGGFTRTLIVLDENIVDLSRGTDLSATHAVNGCFVSSTFPVVTSAYYEIYVLGIGNALWWMQGGNLAVGELPFMWFSGEEVITW